MSDPNERFKVAAEKFFERKIERREVLMGLAATTAALVNPLESASAIDFDTFFQKHYKEMTPDDKKKVLARLTKSIKKDYDVDVTIADYPPIAGVQFGYFLNLLKCNGSRFCVAACRAENNMDPMIDNIRVLEMPTGTFNVEKSSLYYTGVVPKKGKYYMPVQCHQCDNPPCVKVCPVKATWKESDGPIVIDYDWCIGCRYCMAACPYEARSFNFRKPKLDKFNINPNQNYLSNRIRPKGVTEKCTFCLQRTRQGKFPACMEACPTGARKFGNLLDPKSEVATIFREKKLYIFKEELNTVPRFYYYFDE